MLVRNGMLEQEIGGQEIDVINPAGRSLEVFSGRSTGSSLVLNRAYVVQERFVSSKTFEEIPGGG
jgi:hypothetical protein